MKTLAIFCLIALASVARADPLPFAAAGGVDVLTLRDGTILRGHATELKPGDHVDFVLLDGRTQSIEWAQIAASLGPSFPEVPHNPAERFLTPAPGRVQVVLDADRPVRVGVLQARPSIGQDSLTIDDGSSFEQLTTNYQSSAGVVVCTSTPCRIYARPGALEVQVSGDGILSYSSQISVPPGGAQVKLRAPSAAQRRSAGTVIVGGITALVAGGVTAGVGAAIGSHSMTLPTSTGKTRTYTDNSGTVCYGVGGAVLGIGVAALTAGIVMLARNQVGVESVQPLDGTVRF